MLYYLYKALEHHQSKEVFYEAAAFRRKLNNVDFIVDAKDYFEQVSKSLEKAQNEVFMIGWWISPELPLIRPYNKDT